MICINSERTYDADSTCRVVLQADTTPETFPTTGEGVIGVSDNTKFAAGSMLYVVSEGKSYFLAEDGATWNAWGGK